MEEGARRVEPVGEDGPTEGAADGGGREEDGGDGGHGGIIGGGANCQDCLRRCGDGGGISIARGLGSVGAVGVTEAPRSRNQRNEREVNLSSSAKSDPIRDAEYGNAPLDAPF